ncbi:MAG: C10 family peptidase [Planctomycetota bacterium]|jgi:predicted outer membrane repeat protein
MKHKCIVYITVLAVLLLCGGLWARQTTEYEAEMVVSGWLKVSPQPLGANLGRQVKDIETFVGRDDRPEYYIVNLEPSGYVIVSADDRIEPIIGFAAEGIYDLSFENPLVALVTGDLGGRLEAFRNTFGLLTINETQPAGTPQGKWRCFIDLAEDTEGGFGLMSLVNVGDIRVLPLLQSQWGQSKACGDNLFNYYTPDNFPCGCVATAMAQIMRYYEYPTRQVGVHKYEIGVHGSNEPHDQTATTRGGDGLGGPYNWSDMPLRPADNCEILTETQRQAIGAICYDAGIAVKMHYDSSGSGAIMPEAKDAMVGVFQYENAILGYDSDRNIHQAMTEMINPNLDAKAPVILAISDPFDPNAGHAIVCDGYGYESSTVYHHLNMGWSGTDDIWYNLPDIDAAHGKYTTVFGCIYNISTSGEGEIISGRIMDRDGRPIVNAKVSAVPGGREPLAVWTDDRGVYALENLGSNTKYTVSPIADGYEYSSQTIWTRRSVDDSTRVGNRWGVDFYADSAPNPPSPDIVYVDAYALNDPGPGDPAVSDPDEEGSAGHPFDAIQEGIDAAYSGDTVVIMPGTYNGQGNRDLDFKGKAITVRSEDPNDPNLVIIDCRGTAVDPHRGFEFHRYETPASVLDGLTITGGYHELGGAMYCGDYARPTVTNCTFSGNSASLGGGIYNESSPTLENCTFIANSADGGGGIYNNGEQPECKPVISDCKFYANTVTHNGGAMYNLGRYAEPVITRCEFIRNSVSEGGGGAIRNNISGSPTLTNCVFAENSAATFGGAIRNSNSGSTKLRNCTFAANSAGDGSALACNPDDAGSQSPCVLQVINCILWDGGDEIFNDDNSIVNVTYSNVQGGSGRGPWPGEGNIDADPRFADPDNGDYHLTSRTGRWDPKSQSWVRDQVTSPCIDAGDTSTPANLEPSPNGGVVNIGAYGGTEEASKS